MHYLKLFEIKKTLIKNNCKISDAIKSLNNSRLKIVLVLTKNNKLAGTVVDGDVRRGLLKGINLKDPVIKIMNKNLLTVDLNTKKKEAIYLMKANEIQHIPAVNKKKEIFGLYVSPDVISPVKRDSKFIIMAGGKGKRLLPLTKKKPKALIKVYNKPMTEHIIQRAKKFGFFDFVISINYLGNQIKKYFNHGKKLGVRINYIKEHKPLGTAGSLYLLKNLKDSYVLVTNCDVISDVDYADVIDYHKFHSADATIVVKRYETRNPFGVIKTKGNNFISYHEKPVKYENINTGIYVFNTKNFKFLKKEKHKDMNEFFVDLVNLGKKIIVYPVYENWTDLGNKKEYIKNK